MRTFLAVMLVAVVGCKTTPDAAPEPETVTEQPVKAANGPELLLSLKRTPCFGRCPAYTVELFGDGRVRFMGDSNTRERGQHEGTVSAEDMTKIADRFAASDFAKWKSDYMNHQVTDMPGAVVTWKGKTIRHYHGDDSAPADLKTLENDLDVLLGTAKWVRGEASDR